MCGRFTLRAAVSVIAEHFGVLALPPFTARFNIAPMQAVAVVRLAPDVGVSDLKSEISNRESEVSRRELMTAQWGLVPFWADEPSIGARLINARAETAAEKPSFRAAFRRRRCLVPADGFYEWRREGRAREPWLFRMADDQLFAFAGLWEEWEGPDHSRLETCAILTTEANDRVRPVHDRMPVILSPADYGAWLDPSAEPAGLKALLKPSPAELLEAVRVGPYVNKAGNEGPGCVEPVRDLGFY
jgi:putative SOS response-associated peptidase YedK